MRNFGFGGRKEAAFMTHSQSVDACKAYLSCQYRQASKEQSEAHEKVSEPFVTISRQTGAGGITIGEKLVSHFNERDRNARCPWTLFDRNLIAVALEEHNLPQEFAKFMPEDKVSDIQDMIEELFGLHPSEWTLVHKTSETILHLAQMGNVIIVGRGANVITRKFLSTGFHVRLIGSLEMRIRHIQDYYHLTREEAAGFIKKEDEGRRRYLRQNFDKDIIDPLLYDLTINTDFLPYDDAAKLIADEVLRVRARSSCSPIQTSC